MGRTDAITRAALAALTALTLTLAAPMPAQAYKLFPFRFAQRTVVYHNTAHKHDAAVKAAVRAWNRSGVRLRWKAGPRSRADVIIKIERNLPFGAAGQASSGPVSGSRVRTGTIELLPKLNNGSSRGERLMFATVVVAHEMGHLMGLNHEPRRCATMNASLRGECREPIERWRYLCRPLERDDVRGALKHYGGHMRPLGPKICYTGPAPAAPTEVTASTVGSAVQVGWRTPSGASEIRVLSRKDRCPTGPDDGRAEFLHQDRSPRPGEIQTAVIHAPGRTCYAVFALGKLDRPSAAGTVMYLGLPVADFESSPDDPSDPLVIQFVSRSSDDSDLVSGVWDFGDGTTSTASHPLHQYASAGPKNVTLTVTDDEGNTATVTKTIQVG